MAGGRPVHVLERRQRIDAPADQAFAFFADARNLEAITPRWLHFRVLTPGTVKMRPGALIDYRLRLHGLPLRWRTRIEVWEPPRRFVDRQLRGPYALWEHTHSFEPAGAETVVLGDHVRYALPLGRIGDLARTLFVERDLERIFDHRTAAIAQRFAPT
jgi:hypothetical protein